MAERDQLRCALCRHDAGDARRAEHVALLGVAGARSLERRLAHHDADLRRPRPVRSRPCPTHRPCAPRPSESMMGEGGAGFDFFALPAMIARRSRGEQRLRRRRDVGLPHQAFPDQEGGLMPTRSRRATSAGVKMPLSPTLRRSRRDHRRQRSLAVSVVSKVRRLRLLMPIIGERRFSARSSSAGRGPRSAHPCPSRWRRLRCHAPAHRRRRP
jgi:hypothetical protein